MLLMKDKRGAGEAPDLFRAAIHGDQDELQAAIAAGQSLRQTSDSQKTPLHVAAEFGQQDFIIAALEIDSETVHWVDAYGQRAYDYSEGRSDHKAMDALAKAMYPPGQTFTLED